MHLALQIFNSDKKISTKSRASSNGDKNLSLRRSKIEDGVEEYLSERHVRDSDEAAHIAIELALAAERAGSFAVGGFMLDSTGRLLAQAQNTVIIDGKVYDPTAHVERKLVNWYLKKRRLGHDLPPPHEVTVVSSLDPCMMCAGTLLEAGISCFAVAEDKWAGVQGARDFSYLPQQLRAQAEQTFNFLPHVSASALRQARRIFDSSLLEVQKLFESDRPQRDMLLSPRSDEIPHPTGTPGDVENSVVLEDHFRSRIVHRCTGHDHSHSPVLRLIQDYSRQRHEHMHGARAADFPHPRTCSVRVPAVHDLDARMVMDFGAIGSFLEGPPSGGPRPFVHYGHGSAGQLERINEALSRFPPLYSEQIALSAAFADPSLFR